MSTTELLKVDNLNVSYGPARALFDLSLVVEEGAALAVLGANGAGKSSMARCLSGLIAAESGAIEFAGKNIMGWPAHRVRREGLCYIAEGRSIFPGLSVRENLQMAVRWVGSKPEQREAVESGFTLFPALTQRREQRAGTLSGGEQQMLSLACGLAVRPRLLIADELSLGLAPKVVDVVFESLEKAKRVGVTLVLIEQFVHRAVEFCDKAIVLSRGVVAWSGNASEGEAAIAESYIGA